jgi:hypothetical protein
MSRNDLLFDSNESQSNNLAFQSLSHLLAALESQSEPLSGMH